MVNKLAIIIALLGLVALSGCTYDECVSGCNTNYQMLGYNSAQQCIEDKQCSQYDNPGGNSVPEFGVIGASLAIAGAGLYALKRKRK